MAAPHALPSPPRGDSSLRLRPSRGKIRGCPSRPGGRAMTPARIATFAFLPALLVLCFAPAPDGAHAYLRGGEERAAVVGDEHLFLGNPSAATADKEKPDNYLVK